MALCFVLGTQNKLPSASRAVCCLNFPASEGRRALPIAILEVDLYRSIVLDTFVTTACLPHLVPNDNSTGKSSNVVDISEGGYKINVAAGWGSIDSR